MDNDQNFKNLILDFPEDALELFAGQEAAGLEQGARIIPIREEQLKDRLGDIVSGSWTCPCWWSGPAATGQPYCLFWRRKAFPGAFQCIVWHIKEYPEEASFMSTFAERFRQQGMQEGIQQGMQQGMQQGEALLLLRLLSRKFGEIPEVKRRMIESADSERLLQWSERVLTAQSLDEVLQ